MFDKLQAEIDVYNDTCSGQGGKANIQVIQGAQHFESDNSGDESDLSPQKVA